MAKRSAFETIIEELAQNSSTDILDVVTDAVRRRNTAVIQSIPLRCRIIALGFARHFTLEELNRTLTDNGCARLYARSLWEASLIYSFHHGLSFTEWKKLRTICEEVCSVREINDPYFSGRGISLQELKRYVSAQSIPGEGELHTANMTRLLQQRIEGLPASQEDFRAFISENILSFSTVREKTRYYFCKYLYYDLLTRIDHFVFEASQRDIADADFSLLAVFKGIQLLKRKKMSPKEIQDHLLSCDISCGGIFDAFNYFYFEYVSTDWIEALADYCGDLTLLPEADQKKVAAALRREDKTLLSILSDREVLEKKQAELEAKEAELDQIYSLDGSNRGYQRNRAGENTLRKYIIGTLDIDRTTLICFLLYFEKDAVLSEKDRITRERLDQILLSCGYPCLQEGEEFDAFVIGFLEEDDPLSFLMEEVTKYALDEENFYLYRVYSYSVSYSEELDKATKGPEEKGKRT